MEIFDAIKNNDLTKVKEIIEGGFDVNTKGEYGVTALMVACEQGNFDIVYYLLDKANANTHIQSDAGDTALMYAVLEGDVKIIYRLDHYSHKDENNEVYDAEYNRLKIINKRDHKGRTALHTAFKFNKREVIKTLLLLGADITYLDDDHKSPLHCIDMNEGKDILFDLIIYLFKKLRN